MFEKLNRYRLNSYATIAVDIKPVFGAGLLDSFKTASKHAEFEVINGAANSIQLNCISLHPRWMLTIFPQRIQATFLPTTYILQPDTRRQFANLAHSVLEKMEAETFKRMGLQITWVIKRLEVGFGDFAQDFAKQVIRSPICDVLDITDVDPLVKIEGKEKSTGFGLSALIAPMKRNDVLQHVKNSLVHQFSVFDKDNREEFRDFLNSFDDVNLFIEIDVSFNGGKISEFRSKLDQMLATLDSRLAATLDFLGI